jgi:hypothetical protein
MDLQESLWYSIIFLTSVPASSCEYLPKSVRKHTNVCVQQTHIEVDIFVLNKSLLSLVSYYALSLIDCGFSFEGSWFTRFEWTSCFQNVGNNSLPQYTVLLPRKSKLNLQIYIAEPYTLQFQQVHHRLPALITYKQYAHCNKNMTLRKVAESFRNIPSRTCNSGISRTGVRF